MLAVLHLTSELLFRSIAAGNMQSQAKASAIIIRLLDLANTSVIGQSG
jgi:hypothetical protein